MENQEQTETQAMEPTITTPEKTEELVNKEIEIDLDQARKSELLDSAASLRRERIKLELELKGHQEQCGASIKDLKQQIESILALAEKGKETRMIECTSVKDYGLGTVQYIHAGKVVEERALTLEERQQDLFVKGANPIEGRAQVEELMENAEVPEEKSVHTMSDLREAIREETNVHTKHSSVDGPLSV